LERLSHQGETARSSFNRGCIDIKVSDTQPGPIFEALETLPSHLKKEANLLGRGNRATSTIPEWADFVSSLKPIAEQPH
jgi:hypothetical protein